MSTRKRPALTAYVRSSCAVAVLLGSVVAVTMSVARVVAQQPAPAAPKTRKTAPAAPARKVVPKGPGLGVPATAGQVEAADVSVGPDGVGLPAGSGTPAQGEAIYTTKCIACHGPQGAGTVNDRLAGGQGTLTSSAPVKTIGSFWPYATTVFDYVRRAMPYPTPHSLTDPEVYALTAYLLSLNGIIDKDAVMDATTLPKVKMPNRVNFTLSYPERRQP